MKRRGIQWSVLSALGVALLSGCATYHDIDVMSILDASALEPGGYALASDMQGITEKDLLYREFAPYIERGLRRRGLYRADAPEEAYMVILVAYGARDAGWSYHTWATTFHRPHRYYPACYERDLHVTSQQEFQRFLILEAVKAGPWREKKERVPIWKTTLTSTGPSSDLRKLMPILVAGGAPYFGTDTGRQRAVSVREDGDKVMRILAGP